MHSRADICLQTVHDKDVFNEDEFVGRVVIPSLASGETISDWFPLEDIDGAAILGESGERAHVQLSIEYKV